MEANNLKRRLESPEDCSAAASTSKKPRIKHREMLDLSDDVLLFIFRRLNSSDLLNLSEVCRRLHRVSSDESLWKVVNTLVSPLMPIRFRKLLKFVTTKTSVVLIGGCRKPCCRNKETLTPAILQSLASKCPNLETLTLDGCLIDAENIKIQARGPCPV